MKEKYVMGIDIGIASTGWGLLALDENGDPKRIIDAGSLIFPAAEKAKTGEKKASVRRGYRGTRRNIQRKEYRLDRVKKLLYDNGILGTPKDISSLLPSEREECLNIIYSMMVEEYYKGKDITPYDIKVKGLDEKLSNNELAIILCHWAKHRGYKSNREDDSDKSSENGKVKTAISENEKLMKEKNYRIVSEMFLKDDKFNDGIRNTTDNYKMSVTREMYQDEIEKVLDKQIELGTITEEFKDKYLEIWSVQRHYSKGPGYYFVKDKNTGETKKVISPYGSETSLISKMVGECKFDHKPRAPKQAPSSEMFVYVEKLLNLRYKTTGDYTGLTPDELNKATELFLYKETIKYKDITKIIGQEHIIYKNNQVSAKDYKKICDKMAKELGKGKINVSELKPEEKEKFNKLLDDAKQNNEFFKSKGYILFKKEFSKWNPNEWNKIKDNLKLLDEISEILANCKLNEDIKSEVEKSENIPNEYIEPIENMPTFKDHIRLSLEAIYKILPLMLQGKRYDEAASEIFGDFRNENSNTKHDLVLPFSEGSKELEVNQLVLHSLSEARKVINAIIKKYGLPDRINIETARELAKSFEERREIEKRQQENFEKKTKYKQNISELTGKDVDKVTSKDVIKYRLWEEQGEFCPYSLKKITLEDIYQYDNVEIDHILPYSRTFDDSYFNKTLVFKSANQEKKQRTPYEWFGKTEKWNHFKNFISNTSTILDKKKDNYLLEDLTPEIAGQMRNQNLNDTKYIARALVSFLKANLNVKEINTFSGSMTGFLRSRWGLNGLATSYESPTYYVKNDTYEEVKKNRSCNIHHAMDGIVIASMNKSLEMKIAAYEKIRRQFMSATSEELDKIEKETELEFKDYTDAETGDLTIQGFRNYIDDCIKESKINGLRYKNLRFPEPYNNFANEAKVRLYERDINVIKNYVKTLPNYNGDDISSIKVVNPVNVKLKATGSMHAETYFGINKEQKLKYNRIPVEKLTQKNIDDIADKDKGAKEIYLTLKSWLGTEKGTDVIKEKGYPKNPKTGNLIKKVKMATEFTPGKGHIIKEKINGKDVERFVAKESVFTIDVYKKQDDDKLYFVGYDLFDLANIKRIKQNKDIDFDVQLWYGQGSNYEITNYKSLSNKYTKLYTLSKNQLVYIELKNGKNAICYINGFSSGMLEVASVTGDGHDLYGQGKLFEKERSQYQITISTIKEIKKLEITKLGEINGL